MLGIDLDVVEAWIASGLSFCILVNVVVVCGASAGRVRVARHVVLQETPKRFPAALNNPPKHFQNALKHAGRCVGNRATVAHFSKYSQ